MSCGLLNWLISLRSNSKNLPFSETSIIMQDMKTHYSQKSKDKLATCHEDIQTVFSFVDPIYPHTILEGRRSKEVQDEHFRQGRSKVQWPNSKHNVKNPEDLSQAVDAAPDPINWSNKPKNLARFYHFVGFVEGVAYVLYTMGKIKHLFRVGADWDGDRSFDDQTFDDLPHFELKEPK